MLRMTSQIDKVTSIYRAVAEIPNLVGARLSKNTTGCLLVSSDWTQRNLIKNKVVKFSRTYVLDKNDVRLFTIDYDRNELLSAVSPSGALRAVITQPENGDAKDKKKCYLEVWQSGQIEHTFDLAALDIHGDVYADSEFGSLAWSNCETKLAYVAEKKKPKSEPFFKQKPVSDKPTDETPVPKGEEYLFREEWGEALVGKVNSVVILCDLGNETLKVVDQIPEHLCPGQVVWAPDGCIVGVAWDTQPRKLGLVYCTNRKSWVFSVNQNGEYSVLSLDGRSVRAPRFSTDGKWLVWLERPIGGPHMGAHALMRIAWPPTTRSIPFVVIDRITTSMATEDGEPFYGIYATDLPRRCWFNNRVLFSTPQKTEIKSYWVDIETGVVGAISRKQSCGGHSDGSLTILDVHEDSVVASWSTLLIPSQLFLGKLGDLDDKITWYTISKVSIPSGLESHQVECLNLKQNEEESTVTDFAAIYCGSKDTVNSPLIVWPHGGPHSAFVNAFSSTCAFFSLLGFSFVQVNYRGSIGQGQDSIDFLLTRVGDSDVRDCKLAMSTVIEQFNPDPKRCVLFGGSHGGFLVCHLSGQYPNDFAAVVARNAVTDIATMSTVSDIPDWCTVETSGLEFSDASPIDLELLVKMRKMSPVMYAHLVKSPTMLMVGSKDLRVPPSQSISYYHMLKANGCKAKMHFYEDNHPLGTLSAEVDNIINSGLWFLEHTNTE